MKTNNRKLSIGVICLLLFSQIGCSYIFGNKKNLGDGYYTVIIYGDARMLVNPRGSVVVHETVIKVDDYKNYIIGFRRKNTATQWPEYNYDEQPYGYFIFDKDAESLEIGLTYQKFLRACYSYNIKKEVCEIGRLNIV